ncbi:MAG: TlyA family RNA methyltransferase [Acidobacteriaceae bacterium]|nr:TlyA family RNA methyltransferase [Acidobacteriaceae bacterium]
MAGGGTKSGGARSRLDIAVVERGLAASREKAQALILAGQVKVDGQRADKPGRMVAGASRVEVERAQRYVSRGGLKLEAALENFGVSVRGRVCLDVGTSTGGFTDCLLQHGAARVHAVDTGAGQIDWKLRTDSRVILHERVNARYLEEAELGERVDVIACDVSFISLTLLIPALAKLLADGGDWILLIKPQFEVGRELVGKGGIVRDAAAHRMACEKVTGALGSAGFAVELMESPITGAEGNREFLAHGRRRGDSERIAGQEP